MQLLFIEYVIQLLQRMMATVRQHLTKNVYTKTHRTYVFVVHATYWFLFFIMH